MEPYIPSTYPLDDDGRPLPLDSNAAQEWLETAEVVDLTWFYMYLLNVPKA